MTLRAAEDSLGGGIGDHRVAHATIAAPIGGVAHPHQNFVERHHGRDLRLRQHRAEILGDEGHFGIGLGRIGVGVRIV